MLLPRLLLQALGPFSSTWEKTRKKHDFRNKDFSFQSIAPLDNL